MKAVILTDYGDADRLAVQETAEPQAGDGQVRLRVQAVGINPMESKLRRGDLKDQMPLDFPTVLGSEAAGVVDQVGGGVVGLAVGDRVVGFTDSGAYAEYAVTRPAKVAPIPDGLDAEQAVTIPTAAEASLRVLKLLDVHQGETVVVNGAAGAVGSVAVQLLGRADAKVIGTAGPDNHDHLRRLAVTPVTYGDGVVDRIRTVAPAGVDAVFDVTGHDFVEAAIELRGSPDRIVTIADFVAGARGVAVSAGDADKVTAADFLGILQLAATGRFATEVAATLTLDEMPAAHRLSEGGHLRGKIVVRV